MIAALLLACAEAPPSEPPPPAACAVAAAPAPGPLSAERAKAHDDPVATARLFVKEARLTGDAGFYTLAESSLDCALAKRPADADAARLRLHVLLQFHRFAEVEAAAAPLAAAPDATWLDHALLGDARMEQGKLDAAAEEYQRAVDRKPGLETYDRIGWLRWLWGDVDGALEMAKMAASAGSPEDPEPYAWVLTRLGWLHALGNEPSPELDQALQLVPGYKPALLARGRVRLHAGDPDAADDLRAVGPTVEAVWALSELDPTASVEAVKTQDPRGYAMWLTPKDPATALRIQEDEFASRQDATTRMARAWAAAHVVRAGGTAPFDPAAEARAALATGIVEPRVLRMGADILGDAALLERARSMGPGLLPSEAR